MLGFTTTDQNSVLTFYYKLSTKSARKLLTKTQFYQKSEIAKRSKNQRVMFLKAPKHFKSSKRHVVIWQASSVSLVSLPATAIGLLFSNIAPVWPVLQSEASTKLPNLQIYKISVSIKMRLQFMAAALFGTLVINAFAFSLIFWLLTFAAKLTYSNKYSNFKYNFYECGFKHNTKITPAYEMNYLLIILFVLIYDGEFLVLLPLSLNRDLAKSWGFVAVAAAFIIWLVLALLYDYGFKALEWQVVFSFTMINNIRRSKKNIDNIYWYIKASSQLNASVPVYSLVYKQNNKTLRKSTMAEGHLIYLTTACALWAPLFFIGFYFIRLISLIPKTHKYYLLRLPGIESNFVAEPLLILNCSFYQLYTLATSKFLYATVIDRLVCLVILLSLLLVLYGSYTMFFKKQNTMLFVLVFFFNASAGLLFMAGDFLVYFLILELFAALYMFIFLVKQTRKINFLWLKNGILAYMLGSLLTLLLFFIGLCQLLSQVGTCSFDEVCGLSEVISAPSPTLLVLALLFKIGAPGTYFFKLEVYRSLTPKAVLAFSLYTFIFNTLLLYFLLANFIYIFTQPIQILIALLIVNFFFLMTGFKLNHFGFFLGYSALATWSFILICFLVLLSFTLKYQYTSFDLARFRAQHSHPICFRKILQFLNLRANLTKSTANRTAVGGRFKTRYLHYRKWYINHQRASYCEKITDKLSPFLFSHQVNKTFSEAYAELFTLRNLDNALLWKARTLESIFNIKQSTRKKKKKMYYTEVVYYINPQKRINFAWRWLKITTQLFVAKNTKPISNLTIPLENFLTHPKETNLVFGAKQRAYRLFALRVS